MSKRTFIVAIIWFVIGVFAIINTLMGNIVANIIQDRLGDKTGYVILPFIAITALLLGFELRDRLTSYTANKEDLVVNPRHKQAMLNKVEAIWVKGILRQSLVQEIFIELGLENAADAVARPFHVRLYSKRPVPHNTPILDLFQECGEAILILGSPGSGKTTLLLELARELIVRSRKLIEYPIPIVLPLTTWADGRLKIEDWMVRELQQRYDVPEKIAKYWVEKEMVLPLLDGLDEVELAVRDECVEAINMFRQRHGFLPIVVCSRIHDYERLTFRLKLHTAVAIQPLGLEQMDNYLSRLGPAVEGIRNAIRLDNNFRELVQTPLMINLAILAYKDQTDVLTNASSAVDFSEHLLSAYIDSAMQRRRNSARFSNDEIWSRIIWLAFHMRKHSQTVFFVEDLSSSWLPVFWKNAPQKVEDIIRALETMFNRVHTTIINVSRKIIPEPIRFLLTFLITMFVFTLATYLIFRPSIFLSLIVLAIIVALWKLIYVEIPRTETLYWSWDRSRTGLLLGTSIGGGVGAFFGISGVLIYGWRYPPIVSLIVLGLFLFFPIVAFTVPITLLAGLVGGEVEMKTIPNQGIWRSVRSALISTPICGLAAWLLILPVRLIEVWTGNGVLFATICAILCGLYYGGAASIRHFLLRLILFFSRSIPWNLSRFLDYCVDSAILRRIGGGYIFIHRSLLDHLAKRYSIRGSEED